MPITIKNRFSLLSKICLVLALLCLVLAGITLAFAAVTPPGSDAICVVGVSGMSPGVEFITIQTGVYKPSPVIIAHIGAPINYNSSWQTSYDPDTFGFDWLWVTIHLI